MNDHPQESLPAFALGALDTDEARSVIAHVAACPSCRDDVELWAVIVALLPYMATPSDPPAHIKRRLFALVDTAAAPGTGTRPRMGAGRRWVNMLAGGGVALALVFGLLFIDMRQRADMFATQIAERDQAIKRIQTLVDQEHQQLLFVSGALPRQLTGRQPAAVATMFMQPGQRHALLVVRGLKPAQEGKVYQLWFAMADKPVSAASFTVGPDGMAMVLIDTPAPVDAYSQVMITVEQAGGSQTPSDEIVFQAKL
jgi:anti-sigma-K factor RskA